MRGAKVVVPGNLARSILYRRANSNEAFQNATVARNAIDEIAMATLASWINSLPPKNRIFPPLDAHGTSGTPMSPV